MAGPAVALKCKMLFYVWNVAAKFMGLVTHVIVRLQRSPCYAVADAAYRVGPGALPFVYALVQ
jgi:hypothetical protein